MGGTIGLGQLGGNTIGWDNDTGYAEGPSTFFLPTLSRRVGHWVGQWVGQSGGTIGWRHYQVRQRHRLLESLEAPPRDGFEVVYLFYKPA